MNLNIKRYFYCLTFKGNVESTFTTDISALAIGDATLHQSYFVCITESESSTLIEYGKSMGASQDGEVHHAYLDTDNPLSVRFYAFGNDEHPLRVMGIHVVPRNSTKTVCKGITSKDEITKVCMREIDKCHILCDPFAGKAFLGMRISTSSRRQRWYLTIMLR